MVKALVDSIVPNEFREEVRKDVKFRKIIDPEALFDILQSRGEKQAVPEEVAGEMRCAPKPTGDRGATASGNI